jgi:hypothetical protein
VFEGFDPGVLRFAEGSLKITEMEGNRNDEEDGEPKGGQPKYGFS